jgi:hypothetical protein
LIQRAEPHRERQLELTAALHSAFGALDVAAQVAFERHILKTRIDIEGEGFQTSRFEAVSTEFNLHRPASTRMSGSSTVV